MRLKRHEEVGGVNCHVGGNTVGHQFWETGKPKVNATTWTNSSWYSCLFLSVKERPGDTQRNSPKILNQADTSHFSWDNLLLFHFFCSSARLNNFHVFPFQKLLSYMIEKGNEWHIYYLNCLIENLLFSFIKSEDYFLSNWSMVIK